MTDECSEFFKRFKPSKCADIPFCVPSLEHFVGCENKCENKTSKAECCKYECLVQASGIFVDGKYQMDNMFKSYDNYFDVMNSTAADKEVWMAVLKNSFEMCEKLSKKRRFDLIFR